MEYIYNIGSEESEEYHYFRLELRLEERLVNRLDNTSTLAYRLRLYAGARYFYGYGLGARIALNGTTVAMRDRETEPSVDIEKNGYLDILQGETVITHNADGKLTLPVEFSIEMTAGYYTPGNMAGAGELTLTDIPRTSQLRATGANIGEVSMFAITRYSPDYTHSVKYTFGSQTGYVSVNGEGVEQEEIFDTLSLGFLLPESFYEEIPNDPSGICRLEITTYAGSAPIGTEIAQFTATASPVLCAPQVDFTAQDINPVTLAVTGGDTLIRGKSLVQCTVDARGRKGGAVTSVLVNGQSALEFTAVTNTLECVVTDSRGYVTRKTLTLAMIDYVELTCNVSAQRVDPTSGQVKLQVWGQYFDGALGLEDNTLSVFCYPDDREVEIPCTISDNTYQGEAILTDLSYQSAHTVETVATDLLSQVSRTATVNRGVPVFDWGQNDFAFRVPVTVEGSINGVCMGAFSGASLWLTPSRLPQSFFVAGGGVQGVLTAREDGCSWQGTEDVTELSSQTQVGLLFSEDTQGILLSNAPWQT